MYYTLMRNLLIAVGNIYCLLSPKLDPFSIILEDDTAFACINRKMYTPLRSNSKIKFLSFIASNL